MAPNPEAIAWYLQKSEGLLDDLREEVRSLRTRGGQLAVFSGAVLALAGSNAESILHALHGAARDAAGASLLIGFMLLILSLSIEAMAGQADSAARTVEKAEYFFLSGLFTVGASLATLVVVVTL